MCGIVCKLVGKNHLCTEMRGIVQKLVKKTITLYENVRTSDLVEIRFEMISQLDLNFSEDVNKTIVKSCIVELTYKTKDNLMPN